jgi:hypothetical protein
MLNLLRYFVFNVATVLALLIEYMSKMCGSDALEVEERGRL